MIEYLNANLATRYIRKNTKKHTYISNTILTITPHILYYINCNFNYSKLITQIVQMNGFSKREYSYEVYDAYYERKPFHIGYIDQIYGQGVS